MSDNKKAPKTAEDLLQFLDGVDLKASRRRDLKSAIRRICDMTHVTPTALSVDPVALRDTLRKIKPAAHRISQKTWSNTKSLLGSALQLAGLADPMGPGLARQSPTWGPLLLPIRENKRLSHGLAAFANWCTKADICPDAVTDETVQRFATWIETRTLCPKPRDVIRRVPALWNEASKAVEAWPKTKLAPLSFRPPRKRLPMDAFSDSFQADVEAYLTMRAEPDLFDERPNAPRRPLARSTLHQQRSHLRLSASILVESGIPVEEITLLADLIQPERIKTVLRHYHEKAKGKPNSFAIALAKTLIQVAQHHTEATPEETAQLKRIASKLPSVPFELTEKNKALLRELESEGLRAKLLFLPERLMADVRPTLNTKRLAFVEAQVAIAIDFALAVPLRPQNLSRLNWARHFTEPDGPKGRLLLHIPAEETKAKKQDYTAEVPADLARRLRWYRRHILPALSADPNGDLFVTRQGRRKSQETLTQQIIETIEEHVGIHMTPHQFRHFCAVSYLEENPEDMETARALLGHGWSKTTLIYAGSGSRRASRAYGNFVSEQRDALKLKAKQPPRRRTKEPA